MNTFRCRRDFVTQLWILGIWVVGVAAWRTVASSHVVDAPGAVAIMPDSTAWELSTYVLTFVVVGLIVPFAAGIVIAAAARRRLCRIIRWWPIAVTAWWLLVTLVAVGDLATQGPTLNITGGSRPTHDSGQALGSGLTIVTLCLSASLVVRTVRVAFEGRAARRLGLSGDDPRQLQT